MSKVNLKTWLVPKLRNISRMWPEKNACVQAAKVQVQIGFYKNGNPEYKMLFKCAQCEELYDRQNVHVDHKDPIVGIDGFNDWNEFLAKMFCEIDKLQVLCIDCHKAKSFLEVQLRKEQRKLKKKLD